MKFISVSGKNWISKKFDVADIECLKKDFFLDEITAKLLAIRRIDKKNVKGKAVKLERVIMDRGTYPREWKSK